MAPSLEERKAQFTAALAKHEADVNDLKTREQDITVKEKALETRAAQLGQRLVKLQKKERLVELAGLQVAIEDARKELDRLLKQFGEKRTMLDRLIHRKEGQAR